VKKQKDRHLLRETKKQLTVMNGIFALCVLILSAASVLGMAVPDTDAAIGINRQINYQGRLMSAGGSSVSDGVYAMTFRFYGQASGGTQLWSASTTNGLPTGTPVSIPVSVKNGLFTVILGDTSAGQVPLDIDWNQNQLYLGVKIGADAEMAPRKRLTAVPWAFNAEMLQGQHASSSVSATGGNLFALNQAANNAASATRTALYVESKGTSNALDYLIRLSNGTADVFKVNRQGNVSAAGTMNVIGKSTLANVSSTGASISGNLWVSGTASSSRILFINATGTNFAVLGRVNSDLIPGQNNAYSLGSSSNRWKGIWANGVTSSWIGATTVSTSKLFVNGQPVTSSVPTLQQVTTKGNKTTLPILFAGGTSTGSIYPGSHLTYDLGGIGRRWNDVYARRFRVGTGSWTMEQATSGSFELYNDTSGLGLSVTAQGTVTSTGAVFKNTTTTNFGVLGSVYSDFNPSQNNVYSIGNFANRWKGVYAQSVTTTHLSASSISTTALYINGQPVTPSGSTSTLQDVTNNGNVTNKSIQFAGGTSTGAFRIANNLNVTGKTTFNNASGTSLTSTNLWSTKELFINATGTNLALLGFVNSNLVPRSTNAYSLGSTSNRWKNVYTSGAMYSSSTIFGSGLRVYGSATTTNLYATGFVSTTVLFINGRSVTTTVPTLQQVTNQGKLTTNDIRFAGGTSTRNFYVSNGGKVMVGTGNPTSNNLWQINSGTTAPTPAITSSIVELDAENGASSDFAYRLSTNTTGDYSAFFFARSLGTLATPTAVTAGTNLGGLVFAAYDGATWQQNLGEIRMNIDGTTGVGNVPTAMHFSTTPAGSAAAVERLTILNSGNVGVGITAPTARLHVAGTMTVTGKSTLVGASSTNQDISGYLKVTGKTTLTNASGTNLTLSNQLWATTASSSRILFINATGTNLAMLGYVNSNLTPRTANAYTLGTATNRWRSLYTADGIFASGTILASGLRVYGGATTTNLYATGFVSTTALYINGQAVTSSVPSLQQVTNKGRTTSLALQFAGGTSTGALRPSATGFSDLGSSALRWKNVFVANGVYVSTTIQTGNFGVYGNLTTNLISSLNTMNLGSSGSRWGNLFLANNAYASGTVMALGLRVFGGATSTSLSVSGKTQFNGVYYSWPASVGTSGQVLTTNGLGQLNWISPDGAQNLQSVTNQGYVTTNPIRVNGVSSTADILPASNNLYSLGSASSRWANFYGGDIHASGTVQVSNIVSFGGATTTSLSVSGKASVGDLLVNNKKVCLADGTNCQGPDIWSASSTAALTLTTTERSVLIVTSTPSTVSSQIWIVADGSASNSSLATRTITLRIRRGGCTTGVLVGVSVTGVVTRSGETIHLPVSFVDSPATTAPVSYSICMLTSSGAPTVGGRSITAQEVKLGADIGEVYYSQDGSLAPGEVVSMDRETPDAVARSGGAYDRYVLGVVSTQPGSVLSQTPLNGGTPVIVALTGRVPVKVTAENGDIRAGDPLTSASEPGYAMKATGPGMILGHALSDFSSSTQSDVMVGHLSAGTVMLFVRPGYYFGAESAPVGQLAGYLGNATGTQVVQQAFAGDVYAIEQVRGGMVNPQVAQTDALNGSRTIQIDVLVVRTAALFAGDLTVGGTSKFMGHVVVSQDTAGIVDLPVGESWVEIKFARPFASLPVVVVTPESDAQEYFTPWIGRFRVAQKTVNGFRIEADHGACENPSDCGRTMKFNWLALGTQTEGALMNQPPSSATNGPLPRVLSAESATGPIVSIPDAISQPVAVSATATQDVTTTTAMPAPETSAPSETVVPLAEPVVGSTEPAVQPQVTAEPVSVPVESVVSTDPVVMPPSDASVTVVEPAPSNPTPIDNIIQP
jgi:hypothetical protein